MFFPDVNDRSTYLAAVALCKRCPVADECRRTAIDNDERHGIWGGLGADKRRQQKSLAELCSDETPDQRHQRALSEAEAVRRDLLDGMTSSDVNQLERFAFERLSMSELLILGRRGVVGA